MAELAESKGFFRIIKWRQNNLLSDFLPFPIDISISDFTYVIGGAKGATALAPPFFAKNLTQFHRGLILRYLHP